VVKPSQIRGKPSTEWPTCLVLRSQIYLRVNSNADVRNLVNLVRRGRYQGVTPKIAEGYPIGVAYSNFLLTPGLYPVIAAVPQKANHKIPSHFWPEVVQRSQTESLRAIAQDYGVSHESVRRTLGLLLCHVLCWLLL
jgi:hypothetical protein